MKAMNSREKNTKERILEEALKLFARSGYMGTSMNDIAASLGVTKAALYKHYTSKQEILDSIVEKMNQMDMERVKEYDMPEGNMEEVRKGYQAAALDKIKEFTKVQFLHWSNTEIRSLQNSIRNISQVVRFYTSKRYSEVLLIMKGKQNSLHLTSMDRFFCFIVFMME